MDVLDVCSVGVDMKEQLQNLEECVYSEALEACFGIGYTFLSPQQGRAVLDDFMGRGVSANQYRQDIGNPKDLYDYADGLLKRGGL